MIAAIELVIDKKRSGFLLKPGWALVLIYLCLFVSCREPKLEIKYRIGFSQCTFGDQWRMTMKKEMERELAFHPEVELIITDANLNAERQKEQIQDLVKANVDLLIAVPAEAEPIAPVIDEVYQKGVPVIMVDRSTLSKNYTAFIGANNYQIGKDAGAYAANLLKGKGIVMEIGGKDTGSSADIGRHVGFLESIEKYPGIQYVARFNADWDSEPEKWEQGFTELLQYLHKIDLIFSQNDRLGLAAYNVCKKLGREKQVKIIGIDGLPGENGGIDLVEKGILQATLLYPTGGKEAILTAINRLEGKPFNKDLELETTIIDSNNVRMMRLQNEKLQAQQDDIDIRQRKIREQIAITQNQTRIIIAISVTLALALIFGGILFYYLRENKKINRELERQKEEIENQRNQLIALMQKVKEANEAKVNFFTNISHELRTPLTLIMGPLEDALSSSRLHFTTRNNLEFIQRNSLRLLRLINQLMDFRKIEESKMKLQASSNNITAFVTEIAEAFRELAKKKFISYSIHSDAKDLHVWFDVNMLDKVLFNLLSNAFKFTGENGSIRVDIGTTQDQSMALIRVEDSGEGMDKEDADHAFELFYQGHSSHFGGSGLGLSLSKELIQLHRGSISVNSERGKGTSFEIRLPLGNAHLEPGEIVTEKPKLVHTYEDLRIYTTDIHPGIPEKETVSGTVKEHSILVVEDNSDLRLFLERRLDDHYEIHGAPSGEEGIELAYNVVPDLIIADIILPGQSGLQVTETLKQDIRTSHIPIILLTAKGSMQEQIEGIRSRADAFIVKPFNLEYLEESIRNLLRNRSILREHYSSELPTEGKTNISSKIDRRFINEFTSYIEENLSNEKLSVDDISRKIGISRVQLYRKVKALIGYNVNDYILAVRLQKARYLLTHEETSISDVAFKTGFSSQAYFSTVFKSKFGMTPTAFREKNMVP